MYYIHMVLGLSKDAKYLNPRGGCDLLREIYNCISEIVINIMK